MSNDGWFAKQREDHERRRAEPVTRGMIYDALGAEIEREKEAFFKATLEVHGGVDDGALYVAHTRGLIAGLRQAQTLALYRQEGGA